MFQFSWEIKSLQKKKQTKVWILLFIYLSLFKHIYILYKQVILSVSVEMYNKKRALNYFTLTVQSTNLFQFNAWNKFGTILGQNALSFTLFQFNGPLEVSVSSESWSFNTMLVAIYFCILHDLQRSVQITKNSLAIKILQ